MNSRREIHYTLTFIVLCVSMIMNISSLIALIRSRTLSPNIRVLSMNLIVSNVIVCSGGITQIFLGVDMASSNMDDRCAPKLLASYIMMVTYLISLLSITAMAVDRLAAIVFPLKYLEFICANRIRNACIFIWILSLLISTSHHIENSNRIITCANGKYKFENVSIGIMNDSLKVIGITNLIVTTLNIVIFSLLFLYILRNKVSMGVYSFSILRKLLVIFLAYAALYGPFCIITIIVGVTPGEKTGLKHYITTTIVIAAFAYVIDPFLYAWRYKMCRLHIMKILCFFRKTKVEELSTALNDYYCTYTINTHSRTPLLAWFGESLYNTCILLITIIVVRKRRSFSLPATTKFE